MSIEMIFARPCSLASMSRAPCVNGCLSRHGNPKRSVAKTSLNDARKLCQDCFSTEKEILDAKLLRHHHGIFTPPQSPLPAPRINIPKCASSPNKVMSDITKISTTTQKKWLCDVCKEASFESFEEACQHEEECAAAERPGESGELPAIGGGGTAGISSFFAALASDDQRESSSAVANSSLSAAAVTAEPAADANFALVTALERGSEGSMEESNQTIHSRTLVRNELQRGVGDDSLDICFICNEHYNLGSSAGSPTDRRPVLTPNCCGNTLCMQCAELHRTAKVTELSGNKKKIPCPCCNAPFHSENEQFVVNKFAMRYLERKEAARNDVPSSSSSAAASGSSDNTEAGKEGVDVEGEGGADVVSRSGKRKSYPDPDEGDHRAHGLGDKIRKNFPGYGFFEGEITRLPTNERPYYRVEYEDDDTEDIHANDISQYVSEYKRFCRRDEPAEDSSQQGPGQNEEIGDVNNEGVARPSESETKCAFLSSQEVARRAVISNALLEKGDKISRETTAKSIDCFLGSYRDGIFMVSKASFDPLLLKKVEFNATKRRFEAADVHEDNFICQSMLALHLFRFAHGLGKERLLGSFHHGGAAGKEIRAIVSRHCKTYGKMR